MARKSRKNRNVESNIQTVVKKENLLDTAAYIRLSVENGGNETDETLVVQQMLVERFIEEHPDLRLEEVYIDNGFTGTNFERPGFMRLMEDVRSGKVQCIVVKDLSRFGRDYLETGYYLETILPKLNVRFIAITDDYDSSRKEDRENISVELIQELVRSRMEKNEELQYESFEGYELPPRTQFSMLLLDYICSQRIKHGKMPADPVMIKTIVTMDMGEQIAAHYGLRTVNVLTGFKFIGEQIGKLEQLGKTDSYVFGFEESYGYLTGSYVRDKDGVDGAYMICEMFSYYATQGISLLDRLDELYKTYGYCLNTLHSYEFDGSAGFARMQSIMQAFRGGIKEFGGKKVVRLLDYIQGLDGLPKSDVLKFLLEDNCSLVVRPSGTEPKLKIYISVSAENKEMAEEVEDEIAKTAEKWIC